MDQPDDPAGREVAGRDFVTTCYEVFLGRDLDFEGVADERGAWPKTEVLRSIFESEEFKTMVRRPLARSLPFPTDIFQHQPSVRQRLWVTYHLPIHPGTAAAARGAGDWRTLLAVLLNDERLVEAGGMEPLNALRPLTSATAPATFTSDSSVVLEDPHELWR